MDLTTPTTSRRIAVAAWAAAAVGTIVGQLHAVSRGLSHPEDWQEAPLTEAWARPFAENLPALFDWSDPWTVYLAYGKIWAPVALAFTLAAVLVFQHRRPFGWERRLWWVVMAGHGVITVSLFGDYYLSRWIEAFFALGLAGMVITALAGIPLGVMLLRGGFRPRLTAIALISFVPLFMLITTVTSMGNVLLPLAWAWAAAAHHVARSATPADALPRQVAMSPSQG